LHDYAILIAKTTILLIAILRIYILSESLSLSNRQVKIPAPEYVSGLGAGEHGVMFYTSLREMRDIHFAFVKSGLENDWVVNYALPGSSVDELRTAMENYGIEVKKYEADGSLIIAKGEDIYLDPLKPDINYCRSKAEELIGYVMNRKDKRRLRIATDLTSYFLPHGSYVSLFDLENLFGRRSDLPVTLLCAYDATVLPAVKDLDITFFYKRINKEWRKFVDAHSFAIYTSKGKDIIFTI
jgi:hypothetical protein